MTYGINEDGWDLLETQVREEFEFWAKRRGCRLERDTETPWTYLDNLTQLAWTAFHVGHVKGRDIETLIKNSI